MPERNDRLAPVTLSAQSDYLHADKVHAGREVLNHNNTLQMFKMWKGQSILIRGK